MRVLVIEEDTLLLEKITGFLRRSGYVVDGIQSGMDGWHLGDTHPYDIVLLDRMSPNATEGYDALSILRRWREANRTMPVLLVSELGQWRHKVEGLRAGADDYLVKPFEFEELLARIEALIRRGTINGATHITIGNLHFDLSRGRIIKGGAPIDLTALEYRAFSFLAHHKGRVISKTELSEHIYDMNFDSDSNVIEAVISRLRRKLGRRFVQTFRGRGYCLSEQAPGIDTPQDALAN